MFWDGLNSTNYGPWLDAFFSHHAFHDTYIGISRVLQPLCLCRPASNDRGAAVQAGFRCECQLHWKESCREYFIESDRKLGANNLAAFVVKDKQDDPSDQVNPDIQPKTFHYCDKSAVRIWSILRCSNLLCVSVCNIHICPSSFCCCLNIEMICRICSCFSRFCFSCRYGALKCGCVHKIFHWGSVCWLWATLRHLQILREQFQQPRPLRCALQGEITPENTESYDHPC